MAHSPTFVPQTAVPVPHLPLPYLRKVEDADTQTDVMQNAVRVLLVQLVRDGLFWGKSELRWLDGHGVLYIDCGEMDVAPAYYWVCTTLIMDNWNIYRCVQGSNAI